VSGRLQGISALASQADGNMGVLGVGMAVVTAATIGLGVALFGLAKQTAAYEGQFQDLNDQTGIGVKNLSALKLAFDDSGGTIQSGATALSRYLKSVSEANTGNDELKQKFLQVGFTVADLNASYGDSDKAVEILVKRVGEFSNSQDRLNALQKIGVRNAKELNGAIVQMNGDLVKFREEADRLGLVITPEQAQAADDFDEALNHLTKQIKGMGFSIAHQYMPEIQGAIDDVSAGLASNRGVWASWGEFIKTEIRGVRVAAAFLGGMFEGMQRTGGLLGLSLGHGVADAILKSREIHLQDSVGATPSMGAGIFRTKGLEDSGDADGKPRKGKSGAQREAEQAAKRQLQYVTELQREVSKLADEMTGVDTTTRGYAVQQEILNGLLKDARPDMQRFAGEVASSHDAIAKINMLTGQFNDFAKEQTERLASLKPGMSTHLGQALALVENIEKQNVVLDSNKRFWMLFDASILQVTEDAERLNRVLEDLPNNIQMLTVPEFDPNAIGRQIEAKIGAPPGMRDLSKIREQMEDLASDLTGVFDRALFDGIKGGGMRGLQSLTLGFLDMIQEVVLGQLKNSLADALSGAASGGKLNWLLKLLGVAVPTVLGAAAGGIGGGKGGLIPGTGGKWMGANGGVVPGIDRGFDSVSAMLRPGELVLNKQQQGRMMGGTTVITNHFNMTVQKRLNTHHQRRSDREVAERLAALIGPAFR
jgi:hypothetical protein